MTKNVLMVLTNTSQIDADHPTGVWLSEFAEPYAEFKKNGFSVTVASPKGGIVPLDPTSIEDGQVSEWDEAIQLLQDTTPLKEVVLDDFDGIFLPGGHGTMFDLPGNPALQEALSSFASENKAIGSVCHGPAGFVDVKLEDGSPLVAGKQLTGFTDEEERQTGLDPLMPFLLQTKLKELGAKFIEAAAYSDHVVVDGKFVTGQNPQSSQSAAEAFVKVV